MALPNDYVEHVYAGLLGKLIGVYLGRPFEGWSYERITAELGEVWYYVNERLDPARYYVQELVVSDDDITGTLAFLRAMGDYGNNPALSAQQIGQSWLNTIVEGKTILWWGGLGVSTEHTAYLRLKAGIPAPASGSIARNGLIIAEQIGAQIFIDGWAMLAPGDPALAADLARRAASVSHDGAAIHAAQLIAAMEAQAFVEGDIDALLDCGLASIPRDSLIARLVHDVREWHAGEPDWRLNRARIAERYGYDRYGGSCHVVPNHALIMLGLLHGAGDLQRSLMITCTSGWDTDCNAGNLGCLLGIKNGLAGLEAGPDWRGPVADRLYLPTAEGGSAISDALREAYIIANTGRALHKQQPLEPKQGARFHFEQPGAVQGWRVAQSSHFASPLRLENVAGHSAEGSRSLALRYQGLAQGRTARCASATFIPPEARAMPVYELLASPTLYPGQTLRAALSADPTNAQAVIAQLFIRRYGPADQLVIEYGPEATFAPGAQHSFSWTLGDHDSAPIAEVGIELRAEQRAEGSLYLDYLTWEGEPKLLLTRPAAGGSMWRRAWVAACEQWDERAPEAFRLAQSQGTGLISQGTRDWRNYTVSAVVQSDLAAAVGIAARVQGLRRYYALLLCADNKLRLVKVLDGEHVLAEAELAWQPGQPYALRLVVAGKHLEGWVGAERFFDLVDDEPALNGGAVALVVSEGSLSCGAVAVEPLANE